MIFIIIVFSVPVKFLEISWYFIRNSNKCFRKNIEILYYDSYYLSKDLKIEVYEGKIYLNCYTLKNLLSKIRLNNIDNEAAIRFIKDLSHLSNKFRKFELDNQQYEEVYLSKIVTKEGVEISRHYAYAEKGNVMHATSNMPKKLELSQNSDLPINSLIKVGAKNPGTVITENYKNLMLSNVKMYVPKYEIDSIKYNNKDKFDLVGDSNKYIYEKYVEYANLITSALKGGGVSDERIYRELVNNCYSYELGNLDDETIIETLRVIRGEMLTANIIK